MQDANDQSGMSFDARLAKYGLKSDALNADTLRVTSRSKARLDASGRGLAPARLLRPTSIAQLKQWIGVPQSVVARNPGKFAGRRAAKLPPSNLVETFAKAKTNTREGDCSCTERAAISAELREHSNVIRDATRQYVFGDASELKSFERLLDLNLVADLPFWLFKRVVVESGGVLEFGSGMNTLVADTLIIEDGGVIRCEGSLKIDCRRVARS